MSELTIFASFLMIAFALGYGARSFIAYADRQQEKREALEERLAELEAQARKRR